MSKCIECEKEAEFISPAPLCDHHWHLWWYDEDIEYENGKRVLCSIEINLLDNVEWVSEEMKNKVMGGYDD